MAKVLFFMRYPLHRIDNLTLKFDGQMAAMAKLGHEACFLGWDETGIWLCRRRNGNEDGERRTLLCRSLWTRLPGYEHTMVYADLVRGLKRAVHLEKPDAIYMRYMPTFRNAVGALRAAKESGVKLILEHPTYPFSKGKTTSRLREPVFRYTDWVFRSVIPLIDLYTLIGDPNDGTLNGRPAINIANGVDVERLPLHRPRTGEKNVGMLALASMVDSQGYDRILRGVASVADDVTLYLVGGDVDGSLAVWKKLAEELELGERAVFCGQLYGKALNELIERCDIGLGSLSTYRRGQYIVQSLKQREYMARGLPFVYAAEDPDLPETCDFCLRISNDDSLPDMAAILRLAAHAKQDATLPGRMRQYAGEHMSWAKELKPVLEKVGIACQEP